MAWEKLGSTKLTTAGDTITVSDLTAKKHLMVQAHLIPSGNMNADFAFNNETADTNYATRRNNDGGTDTTFTGGNNPYSWGFYTGKGDTTQDRFIKMNIINISDQEKLVIGELMVSGGSSAGSAPNRTEFIAKWSNTSTQITRIDCKNSSTGDFAADSEVTVYGTD